jgi:hypothetical protein
LLRSGFALLRPNISLLRAYLVLLNPCSGLFGACLGLIRPRFGLFCVCFGLFLPRFIASGVSVVMNDAHNDNSSREIFEIAQNWSELKSIRTAPAE